jgi:hypothetical protein
LLNMPLSITGGSNAEIRDGGAFRIYSPDDTNYLNLTVADNGIATLSATDIVNLVFTGISGSIDINGGTAFRLKDATNVDSASTYHNGTNLITDFVGTTEWRVNGYLHPDRLYVGDATAAYFYNSGGGNGTTYHEGFLSVAGTIITTGVNGAIRTAAFQDSTANGGSDIQIAGMTRLSDNALGEPRILGNHAYVDAVTNITGGIVDILGGSGAANSVGAAHGGNILIDGGQGFGTGDDGVLEVGSRRATDIRLNGSSNLVLQSVAGGMPNINFITNAGLGSFARGNQIVTSAGTTLSGYGYFSSGGGDTVTSWHVGFGSSWWSTDEVLKVTSTTIEARNGSQLRFWDATNVDEVNISHDGTDFLVIPSINTNDLMLGDEVGSASQWATVKIPGGGSFRVYDTSPSTHGVIIGTNTNNGSDYGTIGPLGAGGIVINDNWFYSTGGHQDRFVFSRTNKPNGTFKELSMEFRTDNTSIGWDYIWRNGSTSTQIIEHDIRQQDAIGTGAVQWKILDNGLSRVVVDFTSTLTRDLLDLYGGMGLRIRNSLNGDYAEFHHDGLDFQIDCTNTTDFKINEIQNFDLSHSTLAPKLRFNSVVGDKVHWYSTTYFTGVESGTLYHGAGVHRFYSGDAPDAGVSSTFDIGNIPYFFRMRPKELNTTTDQIAIDLSYTVNKVTSGDDTGIRIQKTDTASAGTSRFLDFYTGGLPQFRILDDGQVLLKSDALAGSTPTLAFGDGDTGIYEAVDDVMEFTTLGSPRWRMEAVDFKGKGVNAALIRNSNSTATNPTLCPSASDSNTGIAWAAEDQLVLAVGGYQGILIGETDTGRIYTQFQQWNSQTSPTIQFGDGDTGFFELSDDFLCVSIGATYRFAFTTTSFQAANANGPRFEDVAATGTVPTLIPDRSDTNTGIGANGSDQLSLITGGTEAIRYTEDGATSRVLQTHSAAVGLTADVSSVQGGGVITSTYNVYSTVGTAGDCATLPSNYQVGTLVYVKNDGANSMDVFPASADTIVGAGGANNPVAVAAGDYAVFLGTIAGSTWTKIAGGTA